MAQEELQESTWLPQIETLERLVQSMRSGTGVLPSSLPPSSLPNSLECYLATAATQQQPRQALLLAAPSSRAFM